jgi:glucose 1-dehydrogenase
MGELDGVRALVTGAFADGIGGAIVRELVARGAQVAAHTGPTDPELDVPGLVLGGGSEKLTGDLRDVAECERIVQEAAAALGGLDLLVNNAGVTAVAPIEETSQQLFDDLFGINIRGMYFCTKAAVAHMGEGASIVNLSSIHSSGGGWGHSVYAATKTAINGLTRQLAVELAPRHIRVNAVAPGLIEVPRYFDHPDYTSERGGSVIPWGRVGKPEDIAPVVAFLGSPSATWLTGQVIHVDGGTEALLAYNPDWGRFSKEAVPGAGWWKPPTT